MVYKVSVYGLVHIRSVGVVDHAEMFHLPAVGQRHVGGELIPIGEMIIDRPPILFGVDKGIIDGGMVGFGNVFIGDRDVRLAAHPAFHHAVFVDGNVRVAALVCDAFGHFFAVDHHLHFKLRFRILENIDYVVLILGNKGYFARIVQRVIRLEHERAVRGDGAAHHVIGIAALKNVSLDVLAVDGDGFADFARQRFAVFGAQRIIAVVPLEIILRLIRRRFGLRVSPAARAVRTRILRCTGRGKDHRENADERAERSE